jgi:hypothetical protein
MSSLFSRECSVTTLLAEHVSSGRFAGGDRRVAFRGQPARRGQQFIACWVYVYPVSTSPGASSEICFQEDSLEWWHINLAAAVEAPYGPLAAGALEACLLPSPDAHAAAILLLSPAQEGTGRRRRRRSTAPGTGMARALRFVEPSARGGDGGIPAAAPPPGGFTVPPTPEAAEAAGLPDYYAGARRVVPPYALCARATP